MKAGKALFGKPWGMATLAPGGQMTASKPSLRHSVLNWVLYWKVRDSVAPRSLVLVVKEPIKENDKVRLAKGRGKEIVA